MTSTTRCSRTVSTLPTGPVLTGWHYEQPVEALAGADPAWLGGLISRRVPLSSWPQALTRQPGDVKVAVDLTK